MNQETTARINAHPRCLYYDSINGFLSNTGLTIFGALCENYHGDALTTTRDAWQAEISIMQEVLSR